MNLDIRAKNENKQEEKEGVYKVGMGYQRRVVCFSNFSCCQQVSIERKRGERREEERGEEDRIGYCRRIAEGRGAYMHIPPCDAWTTDKAQKLVHSLA